MLRQIKEFVFGYDLSKVDLFMHGMYAIMERIIVKCLAYDNQKRECNYE